MACHSKLRCKATITIQFIRLEHSLSRQLKLQTSTYCSLADQKLVWSNSRKEFVVSECVKTARGCCCFMMFLHGGMEEWRHGRMLIWERWQETLQFFSRLCRLLTWHFAEVPSPPCVQNRLWQLNMDCRDGKLVADIWSREATASALTLSEISSNEALVGRNWTPLLQG